jgi:hypothetical protein
MEAEALVTLLCPPGAADAPISHGTVGYEAYRGRLPDGERCWLVDVPAEVAQSLIRAGFKLLNEAP